MGDAVRGYLCWSKQQGPASLCQASVNAQGRSFADGSLIKHRDLGLLITILSVTGIDQADRAPREDPLLVIHGMTSYDG